MAARRRQAAQGRKRFCIHEVVSYGTPCMTECPNRLRKPRFSSRSLSTVANSFVIPSDPGFPTSPRSPQPLMWFSSKRTTRTRPKPQYAQEIRGSRGICSSANLSWRCFETSLAHVALSLSPQYSLRPATTSLRKRLPLPCHPDRSGGTCGSADLSWESNVAGNWGCAVLAAVS